MSEKEKQTKDYELFGQKMTPEEYQESMDNLVGLFNLLFKIDKRIHPENYTKTKNRQT